METWTENKEIYIASTAFQRTDTSKKTGFHGKICIKACLEIEKTQAVCCSKDSLQSSPKYFISIELNKSFAVLARKEMNVSATQEKLRASCPNLNTVLLWLQGLPK